MSMNKTGVSVVILHNNQVEHLEKAVKSVEWADEIIVIDHSPLEITKLVRQTFNKSAHVRIVQRVFEGDFSKIRNSIWKDVHYSWCLFLDADERCTPELHKQILGILHRNHLDGMYVYRSDYFLDRFLRFGETSSNRFLRIVRTGKFIWRGSVHETLISKSKQASVSVFPKQASLLHYSYSTLTNFFQKIDLYTTIASSYSSSSSAKNLIELLIYPPAKFVKGYLFQQGFRDGVAGFCLSYFMSLHSVIVRIKRFEVARSQG